MPECLSVSDVEVRLALPEERVRWHRLTNERHELGFLRSMEGVIRLRAAEPHPEWEVARQSLDATEDTLPSVVEELRRVPEFRQAPGASTKAVDGAGHLRAGAAGGQDRRQRDLAPRAQHTAGASCCTGYAAGALQRRFIPPSRATIRLRVTLADSDEVQAAANHWTQAHPLPDHAALAMGGKRTNGVIRNGEVHHETATLITHGEGLPAACRMCHEEGGEHAAALALLEDAEIRAAP